MFRVDQGKNKALTRLANEFYTRLNPVKKSGSNKKNALKKRVSRKCKSERDTQKKKFYQELRKNNYALLKKIITSGISELTGIQNHFDSLVVAGTIPQFFKQINGIYSSTPFGDEILELFNYTTYRRGTKFNWLVEELDIFLCPYCNYEHTFQIKSTNNVIILHDFDHFIPKVVAPYLSLSFFNLIPSCHNCNSTLKGTTIFTEADYIYPYLDDLHSLTKFSIDTPVVNNNVNSFNIVLMNKTNDANKLRKISNHKFVFQIQARYNNFRSDVVRLNEIKNCYTESQKLQYLNSGIMGDVFKDRNDLIKWIGKTLDIPIDSDSAKRQSKGKFKMDIAFEFSIIP